MGRVFNIGLGWVLEKIPGSGSGQVGVFIYTIRYLFYSPVFPGIPRYFWVYWILSLFLKVVSQILKFCPAFIEGLNYLGIPKLRVYPKYWVIPETSDLQN